MNVKKTNQRSRGHPDLTITTSRHSILLHTVSKINKHSMSSYLRLAFHTWLYSSLFVGLLEAKKTTWLPALLGRPRARALTSHVLVVIAKLIFLTPWFCVLIWIDEHVIRVPIMFPRTRSEIMERRDDFFDWLRRSALWRASKSPPTKSFATNYLSSSTSSSMSYSTTRLLSIQDSNPLEHEPDKNVDTVLLTLHCSKQAEGEEEKELADFQLFVKFSCGRNFPLALQVRVSFEFFFVLFWMCVCSSGV